MKKRRRVSISKRRKMILEELVKEPGTKTELAHRLGYKNGSSLSDVPWTRAFKSLEKRGAIARKNSRAKYYLVEHEANERVKSVPDTEKKVVEKLATERGLHDALMDSIQAIVDYRVSNWSEQAKRIFQRKEQTIKQLLSRIDELEAELAKRDSYKKSLFGFKR